MLRTLPVNILKLYRGFVQHLPASETDAQHSFLANIGCDMLRGFLSSPPVSAKTLEALIIDRFARAFGQI